jgi:DNA-binding MarR family transcriptional regulator
MGDMSTAHEVKPPRTPGVSDADWRLWREFVTMHRHLARELDRQLQRDAGISQADFSVMATLAEAPDRRLRTGELAELLAWEKSRVSHQVARMESRGLLERTECNTDGRGTWVGLTTEGHRTMLASTRDHADAVRALFFDELADDEKAALGGVARRILDRLNPVACEIAADNGMSSGTAAPSRVSAA